jgi:hypothetical protein
MNFIFPRICLLLCICFENVFLFFHVSHYMFQWDRNGYSHKIIGVFCNYTLRQGCAIFFPHHHPLTTYVVPCGIRNPHQISSSLTIRKKEVWVRREERRKRNNFVFRGHNRYLAYSSIRTQRTAFIHDIIRTWNFTLIINQKNSSVTSLLRISRDSGWGGIRATRLLCKKIQKRW